MAALLAAGVEAQLAPDQPIPLVYGAEPLIVALESDEERAASVRLEVQAESQPDNTTVAVARLNLRAHDCCWWAAEGIPTQFGRYKTRLIVQDGPKTWKHEGVFCRTARPAAAALPIQAHAHDLSRLAVLAYKSACVRQVRLDADQPDLASHAAALKDAGLRPIVRVPLDAGAFDAGALAESLHGRVHRWEIRPSPQQPAAVSWHVANHLRRVAGQTPAALVVDSADQLAALLEDAQGMPFQELVYAPAETGAGRLSDLRAAYERAGYERLPMRVSSCGMHQEPPPTGAALARWFLDGLAAGAQGLEIRGAWVYDGAPGPAYAYLSGLAHRLEDAVFVGRWPGEASVHAPVFRTGATWITAVWTAEEAPQPVAFDLGEPEEFDLRDGLNNPLPSPAIEDGRVHFQAGQAPLFLVGKGGQVLRRAAWNRAQRQAAALTRDETLQPYLPPGVAALAAVIAQGDPDQVGRKDFFMLLQAYPTIEQCWHEHRMPRAAAVPMLAALNRLVRALCTVEQEEGRTFIAPLQDTLAQCRDNQSLYLVGSAAGAGGQVRGDWLFAEVDRLMHEAQTLERHGRPIEADAVAAMAEWRARALVHAAKASPLNAPDPFVENAEAQR